jgi:uncharacterized membrane protein
MASFLWEGIACVIAYCCFGLRPKDRASIFLANDVSDVGLSEYTGFEGEQRTIIHGVVSGSIMFLVLGYVVVFIVGYSSMRHREVVTRATLSGDDTDEILSSRTARCCIALEKHSKKQLTSAPEGEIKISGIYKSAFAVVTWVTPVLVVGSGSLIAMRYIDPWLWLLGVALSHLCTVVGVLGVYTSTLYLFADLTRELRYE